MPTPYLAGRRAFVSAATLAALTPAAARGQLAATPRQALGPFYPVDWSGDADGDLVRVSGEAAEAQGTVTHLRGRILDARGEPVAGAAVEIWQCDALGIYRHPRDGEARRDMRFQGRGRVVSGPDGLYAFRTIRPVAYSGRTPHIHLAVGAPGRPEPLVTQLYVEGEPLNERDGLFRSIRDPAAREALMLRLQPADRIEPRALLAMRDIVLG
jgi:protocatechuate 3,4-dioxygenase beta subunit